MTHPDKEREAFEAWAEDEYDLTPHPVPMDGAEYEIEHTQCAFDAWQSALASLPTMTERELVRTVGMAYHSATLEAHKPHAIKAVVRALISRLPHIVRSE